MNFITDYFNQVHTICDQVDKDEILKMIDALTTIRERGGRLFFLGVGGGAANATHAVNDFRKIAGMECYTPTDNPSELTARVNDDGWDTAFVNWLKGCRLNAYDGVFVFSVGGGSEEKQISVNIVNALRYAREQGTDVLGVVGRDGGYTARVAKACVIVPTVSPDTVTAHTESFQAVVWHLIVSHDRMKVSEMKWEQVAEKEVVHDTLH